MEPFFWYKLVVYWQLPYLKTLPFEVFTSDYYTKKLP